jgi:iron complex transport system substrate-binding protein
VIKSLLLLSSVMAACGHRDAPLASPAIVVEDDNGQELVLEQPATRVVSLVPAATEIIEALGAASVLIATADEDSAAGRNKLPSVGRVLDPSVERIIALDPDVVIAWADASSMLPRLDKSGVAVYAVRFERLSASISNTRRIGAILGLQRRADNLADSMAARLELMRGRFANTKRPTVLYVLDTNPLWTAGSNTFVNDMIEVAGGTNAFGDLPAKWSQVALESVVARQPDVIVIAQPNARARSTDWMNEPAWRQLSAVKNKHVHIIDADRFNRPGPNVVATVSALAELLHPKKTK